MNFKDEAIEKWIKNQKDILIMVGIFAFILGGVLGYALRPLCDWIDKI